MTLEIFNHTTSSKRRSVCLKGWKVSGILGAVQKGLNEMPSLDPFNHIDLLFDNFESAEALESTLASTLCTSVLQAIAIMTTNQYEGKDEKIFDVFENEDSDV